MPGFFERMYYAPVEGSPAKQYKELHWGIEHRAEEPIILRGSQVEQQAVLLGLWRAFVLDENGHGLQTKRRPYPRLVVGTVDNRLYFAGDGLLAELARDNFFGEPGEEFEIFWVHYDARKGPGRSQYWVHEFDSEQRPLLVIDDDGFPLIVGGSYFVAPEGIVG